MDVVIHSYRHRFGGVAGAPALDEMEAALALQPKISVPTIVLQGADDGVDPPACEDTAAAHFSGRYERQIVTGAGHNLPQEAPAPFVAAILDLM